MSSYWPKTPIVRRKVRLDDRTPMSTAQVTHDRFNAYFQEKFGAPFRNSLHTSGDGGHASSYGNLFEIYPIGDFEFVWSPKVNDIAFDVIFPPVGGFTNVPRSQEVINKKLDTMQYTNKNLIGAIESGNEIMIRSKSYYAVKLPGYGK